MDLAYDNIGRFALAEGPTSVTSFSQSTAQIPANIPVVTPIPTNIPVVIPKRWSARSHQPTPATQDLVSASGLNTLYNLYVQDPYPAQSSRGAAAAAHETKPGTSASHASAHGARAGGEQKLVAIPDSWIDMVGDVAGTDPDKAPKRTGKLLPHLSLSAPASPGRPPKFFPPLALDYQGVQLQWATSADTSFKKDKSLKRKSEGAHDSSTDQNRPSKSAKIKANAQARQAYHQEHGTYSTAPAALGGSGGGGPSSGAGGPGGGTYTNTSTPSPYQSGSGVGSPVSAGAGGGGIKLKLKNPGAGSRRASLGEGM